MPLRCILPTCSNNPDKERYVALHKVPFFNDDRPEAKRRRKRWVDFINSKRADPWQLSKDTSVCSKHFTPDSFVRKVFLPGTTPRLIRDDIGVVPFPTILEKKNVEEMSERTRRKVRLGPFTSMTFFIECNPKAKACRCFYRIFRYLIAFVWN